MRLFSEMTSEIRVHLTHQMWDNSTFINTGLYIKGLIPCVSRSMFLTCYFAPYFDIDFSIIHTLDAKLKANL